MSRLFAILIYAPKTVPHPEEDAQHLSRRIKALKSAMPPSRLAPLAPQDEDRIEFADSIKLKSTSGLVAEDCHAPG